MNFLSRGKPHKQKKHTLHVILWTTPLQRALLKETPRGTQLFPAQPSCRQWLQTAVSDPLSPCKTVVYKIIPEWRCQELFLALVFGNITFSTLFGLPETDRKKPNMYKKVNKCIYSRPENWPGYTDCAAGAALNLCVQADFASLGSRWLALVEFSLHIISDRSSFYWLHKLFLWNLLPTIFLKLREWKTISNCHDIMPLYWWQKGYQS